MVKITLEIADNGTIKTISDDNSNGAGSLLETKTVYDFDKNGNKRKIEFFYELASDLGIDTGNAYEKNNIVMNLGWGSSYMPSEKEIDKRIKALNLEIEALNLLIEPEENDEDETS